MTTGSGSVQPAHKSVSALLATIRHCSGAVSRTTVVVASGSASPPTVQASRRGESGWQVEPSQPDQAQEFNAVSTATADFLPFFPFSFSIPFF